MTMTKQSSVTHLLNSAYQLRDTYGWNIIPVVGKIPPMPWAAFQSSRPTNKELKNLFKSHSPTGIAVILGSSSNNLVCSDFDDLGKYIEWQEQHKEFAASVPTTKTFRGRHLYFNSVTAYQNTPYGEYRGDNKHYSILPPSLHPKGISYEWIYPIGKSLPVVENPAKVGLLPESCSDSMYCSTDSSICIPSPTPNNLQYGIGNICWKAVDSAILPMPEMHAGRYRGWMIPQKVLNVVLMHIPTQIGQRNSCLMDLVRHLKGLPVKWDSFRAWVVFREWWRRSVAVVGTKQLKVSWVEFLKAWSNCRVPQDRMDVEELYREASMRMLPERADSLSDNLKLLLGACIVLHSWHGGGSFYFSAEDAGRMIGVGNKMWGSRAFKRLCDEGFLERISTGSNLTGKASYYRYVR